METLKSPEHVHARGLTLFKYQAYLFLRFNSESFLYLHRMPDCIFLHFEQGLNLERFEEGNLGHYVMTQFIQYKRNPDHFICWTRDPKGTRVLRIKSLCYSKAQNNVKLCGFTVV